MKKLVVLLCMLAAFAFAQKVEFQAFAGSKDMLKLGKPEGAVVPFMMQVKGEGWAFAAQGKAVAPGGDPNTLIDAYLDGSVYVVVAYISELAGGTDSKDYQVGMIDARLYMEDEALETRGVKFKLLPPANDEWAQGMANEAVSTGASVKSQLWEGKYDVAITRTAAVPLDNDALNPKPKAKRVVKDDSDKPVVKRRVVKKATDEDDEDEAPVVKKRVVKKKRVADDDDEPVVKKKVVKKRKVVVEEDDDEDEGLTIKEKRRRAAARKNAAQ